MVNDYQQYPRTLYLAPAAQQTNNRGKAIAYHGLQNGEESRGAAIQPFGNPGRLEEHVHQVTVVLEHLDSLELVRVFGVLTHQAFGLLQADHESLRG